MLAFSCPSVPGAPGSLTLSNLSQDTSHNLFCNHYHYQPLPWCCRYSTFHPHGTHNQGFWGRFTKGQVTPGLNSNDVFDCDGKDLFLIAILMKPRSGLLTEVAGSLSLKVLKNRLYTLCHVLFSSSWVCPGADTGYGSSQCFLLPYYYLLKQKLNCNLEIKHFSCKTQV